MEAVVLWDDVTDGRWPRFIEIIAYESAGPGSGQHVASTTYGSYPRSQEWLAKGAGSCDVTCSSTSAIWNGPSVGRGGCSPCGASGAGERASSEQYFWFCSFGRDAWAWRSLNFNDRCRSIYGLFEGESKDSSLEASFRRGLRTSPRRCVSTDASRQWQTRSLRTFISINLRIERRWICGFLWKMVRLRVHRKSSLTPSRKEKKVVSFAANIETWGWGLWALAHWRNIHSKDSIPVIFPII